MGVGSLREPWEYDGRLPPDAGYYLDLVIPRKEESRKKITVHVRLLHVVNIEIERSTHMQINPRIVANLLANLPRTNP